MSFITDVGLTPYGKHGISSFGGGPEDRAWNGYSGPDLCESHPGMTKTAKL